MIVTEGCTSLGRDEDIDPLLLDPTIPPFPKPLEPEPVDVTVP